MKEIKYEVEGCRCLTPCPFRKNVKVGSSGCEFYCRHLVIDDVVNRVVTCNHPEAE